MLALGHHEAAPPSRDGLILVRPASLAVAGIVKCGKRVEDLLPFFSGTPGPESSTRTRFLPRSPIRRLQPDSTVVPLPYNATAFRNHRSRFALRSK